MPKHRRSTSRTHKAHRATKETPKHPEQRSHAEVWSCDYEQRTWLSTANFPAASDDPLGELYVNAMYFALATMTTVGYGDVKALNQVPPGVARRVLRSR